MENYCAFSKGHTCLKWLDYMLTLHELEEADALCHENWIKIDWQTLKNFDYPYFFKVTTTTSGQLFTLTGITLFPNPLLTIIFVFSS